ncbi:hypothetical protein F0L74_22555 [Chitinophaga agrisoli]|uniref:Uncharacterized protein n=1 Tax=Chitinophaga agrisoli TaxID=2607653 RepID=A0A5B2VJZ6_9BACT|nr:hypothetical protein [Chitinophaga agrisoli]KAA2238998.1 hypothetical protein F0L74_22555 [Chitinophaga agrisoli]
MKRILILFLLLGAIASHAQPKATDPKQLREGAHNFSLQWIGWENPGKVQITHKSGDLYFVTGEQRSADKADFVTISGTLKVLSAQELLFEGTIQTRYSDINNGQVCDKTGTYHFLAKGERKYWRLQEMDNCGGNSVVDYVDIFF